MQELWGAEVGGGFKTYLNDYFNIHQSDEFKKLDKMQEDSKIKLYKEYVNLFNQLEIVVQKSTELN